MNSRTATQNEGTFVSSWTDKPYTSVHRRYQTVEHRILFDTHGRVGVDIIHEVRSKDSDQVPDEWTACEVYEIREHGTDHIQTDEIAGWLR